MGDAEFSQAVSVVSAETGAAELRLLESGQSQLYRIRHQVERLNEFAKLTTRSDLENYLNGHIQFLFEYAAGRDKIADRSVHVRTKRPNDIAAAAGNCHMFEYQRGIRYLGFEHVAGNLGIICRWDQQPVFVDNIKLVDQIQNLIPSWITVRCECPNCVEEPLTSAKGQSVLYGFVEPSFGFGKRKLNSPALPLRFTEGEDSLGIGMIKSGPQVMNGIAACEGNLVYDGFVFLANVARCLVFTLVSRMYENGRCSRIILLISSMCSEARCIFRWAESNVMGSLPGMAVGAQDFLNRWLEAGPAVLGLGHAREAEAKI